ncbi:MAG: peptidoglycan DD-metalloendopeptidase family protein [Gammaproteobacteria bacterium]|nr:peptidoglycan DD-metalloendopeptidase family protein [Gammaproteobacteria bacterium]
MREVRAGDTLYSIAWESGRDFREVAAWNDIDPPYLIKPGQRIRLQPPRGIEVALNSKSQHTVVKGQTLYRIALAAGVSYQDLASWNDIEPPYALTPGQQLRLTPPVKSVKKPVVNESVTPKPTPAPTPVLRDATDEHGAVKWMWPTEGHIISRFTTNGVNKGIDIGGTAGQPIHAAAAGKVVYQGSGLRGYGQLIIVKHNADFLSAYAHCATIYVQEGSVIKPGQVIATMGNSGTDRVKLHFEIRRRGVPVDPIDHLPKK